MATTMSGRPGLSQTQILARAERLASALAGGVTRVERNVLLAVVGDFMADRRPEIARLRRTLVLLRAGSGGHLKRGGSYAAQVAAVAEEVGAFLDDAAAGEGLEPADLKSVFAWTARLLLVRGLSPSAARAAGAAPRGGGREGGGAWGAGGGARDWRGTKGVAGGRRGRGDQATEPQAPRTAPLGAVGGKSRSTLESLKKAMEQREKDEEVKP